VKRLLVVTSGLLGAGTFGRRLLPQMAARAAMDLVTDWPLADRELPPGIAVHRGVRAYSDPWRELWRARENAGPELIHDGTDGLLVAPGDAEGLVQRAIALHRDRARAA
jgi:hypothetical protein